VAYLVRDCKPLSVGRFTAVYYNAVASQTAVSGILDDFSRNSRLEIVMVDLQAKRRRDSHNIYRGTLLKAMNLQ
jgi:hypothetical protein